MSIANAAAEHWETRYRENGRSWSGSVNVALEREVHGIRPGTALDLGSGEGGDALWLARNGWSVTAVDIAPTALAIGAASQRAGDDITWIAADLAAWEAPDTYDLVTSCFLHSTVELPRSAILRRLAQAVAPGGLLLIVGHSGAPHWPEAERAAHSQDGAHVHPAPDLPTPQEVLAELFHRSSRLAQADWTVLTEALIERELSGPDGTIGTITDSVVKLRRNGRRGVRHGGGFGGAGVHH